MNSPRADYRGLRLRNLTSPQYRHLLLLLGWAVYFLLYYLTENLIPPEKCHVIHCALDDRIPFCEYFAIFYVGWYFLIAGSLVYFLLYDIESFRTLQTYIITVQLLATAVYVLYPTCHTLRPADFPRENLFTAVMALIYRLDTPTGILPSLHAAISIAIASTWLRKKNTRPLTKTLITLFCLGICLSVAFVKQHSVMDVLAAIPLCLTARWIVSRSVKCFGAPL